MNNKENIISIFAQDKIHDVLWLKRLSFTNILICSNMMQTMFSKTQNGITSKQWLLLTIASNINCSNENAELTSNILEKIFRVFSDKEINNYFKGFLKVIHNIEKN